MERVVEPRSISDTLPLNIEEFGSLTEAKIIIEDWRIEYNTYRPHSSLDWLTPTEFIETNNPDRA